MYFMRALEQNGIGSIKSMMLTANVVQELGRFHGMDQAQLDVFRNSSLIKNNGFLDIQGLPSILRQLDLTAQSNCSVASIRGLLECHTEKGVENFFVADYNLKNPLWYLQIKDLIGSSVSHTVAFFSCYQRCRSDGKGFPYELSAERLPLIIRILAVADRFAAAAVSSSRRSALSFDECVDVLRNAGSTGHLCKESVDRFVRCNASMRRLHNFYSAK